MKHTKTFFILAAVLMACSALLFQATPSFATDNVTVNVTVEQNVTVAQGSSWLAPPSPPLPPVPPAPPPPPAPLPPAPVYIPPAPVYHPPAPVYHPPAPVYHPPAPAPHIVVPSYNYNCCYTDCCYTGCYPCNTGCCPDYCCTCCNSEYCSVGLHPDYCYSDCCPDPCYTDCCADPCCSPSCTTSCTTTTTTTTTSCGDSCHSTVVEPLISSFSASPSSITPGQQVVLSWTVTNADTVLLSPGVGSVSNTGSFTVTPTTTTTYTLTASRGGSTISVSASTTVTVTPAIVYSQPSVTQQVVSATTSSSPSFLTMGIGGKNGLPLYVLFIILLVIATTAIIIYMRRQSAAPAYATSGATGIRTGTATSTSSATSFATPRTSLIGSGIRGKFATMDGKAVTIPDSGYLGREDLRSLAEDKAGTISREHLRIKVDNGDYYIEDRNSTNGTKVNGTSINGRGRLLLKDGDLIELANAITIKFKG